MPNKTNQLRFYEKITFIKNFAPAYILFDWEISNQKKKLSKELNFIKLSFKLIFKHLIFKSNGGLYDFLIHLEKEMQTLLHHLLIWKLFRIQKKEGKLWLKKPHTELIPYWQGRHEHYNIHTYLLDSTP